MHRNEVWCQILQVKSELSIKLALIIANAQLLLFICDQIIYHHQVGGSSHVFHLRMTFKWKKKGHLLSLCDRKPLCYSMKCIYFLPITHKKISAVILFLSHNPINLNAALHLKVAGLFFLFLCVPCVFHTKKCLFCYKWQKENLKGCCRIIKAPFYSIPGRIRLIVLLTKELESVNIVSAGRSEKYLLCSRVDYSEGGNNPTELQKLAISPIHFQNPDVFNLLSLNLMVFLFMPMNPFYHALSC